MPKPPETEEQRRERVARISRQIEEFLVEEAERQRERRKQLSLRTD